MTTWPSWTNTSRSLRLWLSALSKVKPIFPYDIYWSDFIFKFFKLDLSSFSPPVPLSPSICLSAYLFVNLHIYLSICISICLSAYLYRYVCISIYILNLSINPSIYLSISLSVSFSLSVSVSLSDLFITNTRS